MCVGIVQQNMKPSRDLGKGKILVNSLRRKNIVITMAEYADSATSIG